MNQKKYREEILKQYLSTSYDNHKRQSLILGDDLKRNLTFFKHNYLRHLPKEKNAKILELGCGMGQFLEFLKSNHYTNYSGIDESPEVVEYCRKNGHTVHKINFFDFFNDINNGDLYDVIVVNDVIEHFDKNELFKLIDGIKKSLKKGGILIIKTPNASNIYIGTYSRYCDLTHELIFTETSLRQLFATKGFSNIELYEPNLFCFYTNVLNYIGWLLNIILKYIQILIHRLYGSFNVTIVSGNIIAVIKK